MESWKKYEDNVYEECKTHFANATVKKNVKITGKYTSRKRQIDVCIDEDINGYLIRTVVDCKQYSKKIDVKQVESFIGMMADVSADRGIMISDIGYTKAALLRAHNNPHHLELDICSFKELTHRFQGFGVLAYSGTNGVTVRAPLGYLIDIDGRNYAVCFMYPIDQTYESSFETKEWAYINFWTKNTGENLNTLLELQSETFKSGSYGEILGYIDLSIKNRANGKIRVASINGKPFLEVTGFVEFEDFIVFCVWFTEKVNMKRNIRKFTTLLQTMYPFKIKHS